MALLGGVLPLRIMSRREPRNQALDRALSCSEATGYYGMDRSGQFGISAAEVVERLVLCLTVRVSSVERSPESMHLVRPSEVLGQRPPPHRQGR